MKFYSLIKKFNVKLTVTNAWTKKETMETIRQSGEEFIKFTFLL